MKLYDAGKIFGGLLIFLALLTSPTWYNLARGKAVAAGKVRTPEVKIRPELVAQSVKCVKPKDIMRAEHMDLLNQWRDSVVRQGKRVFVAHDGRKFNMSLTNTCMDCHSNKAEFCDACHDFSAVATPNCWDCHNTK